MITRNEAFIITAAVALAMAPRFEARVQQYAQAHRAEIQMAMNQLQGKPAIPFAGPTSDQPDGGTVQLASLQGDAAVREMRGDTVTRKLDRAEEIRAHVDTMRAERASRVAEARAYATAMRAERSTRAAEVRVHLAELQPVIDRAARAEFAAAVPQLANLRFLEAHNKAMVKVYRLQTKKCPIAPVAPSIPGIPAAAPVSVETSSLP